MLGRRIQQLRKQRGLTQEELGARLAPQLSRASIANIESAKQRVLAHSLAQIAESLEVSPDDLMRERPSRVDKGGKQQVQAQLQHRLKLSPRELKQLTRKLGLEHGAETDDPKATDSKRPADSRESD